MIAEIQKDFLKEVSERIHELGFEKKQRDQSFYRPFEKGRAVVHFSFIKHEIDIDVTVDIALRFDELEELINKEKTYLSNREKARTSSLGVELGNLIDGKQKRWNVKSSDELDSVVNEIIQLIKNRALPYLAKYSDMEEALKILAKDTPEAWLHSPCDASRAMRAVALAWILGKKQELDELIEAKRKFLASREKAELETFLRFINSKSMSQKFESLPP